MFVSLVQYCPANDESMCYLHEPEKSVRYEFRSFESQSIDEKLSFRYISELLWNAWIVGSIREVKLTLFLMLTLFFLFLLSKRVLESVFRLALYVLVGMLPRLRAGAMLPLAIWVPTAAERVEVPTYRKVIRN